MKSRLLLCAALLALFAVPVFADSVAISFTNQGVLSGSLNSGITSTASDLAFDGTVIAPGPFATLSLNLGSLTGSLTQQVSPQALLDRLQQSLTSNGDPTQMTREQIRSEIAALTGRLW